MWDKEPVPLEEVKVLGSQSHFLHGGGEARSVVRVGVSLKGLRKRRHNLSGASKAMATFAY